MTIIVYLFQNWTCLKIWVIITQIEDRNENELVQLIQNYLVNVVKVKPINKKKKVTFKSWRHGLISSTDQIYY